MIATCTQTLPRVVVEQRVTRAAVTQGRNIEVQQQVVRGVVDMRKVVAQVQVGGLKGDKGDPGDAGSGGLLIYPAGETIHGLRAVRLAGGLLFHPDTAIVAHAGQVVGIATQSGAVAGSVIVRAAGTITEAAWSWSPGPVWVGSDGVLTQSPAAGWLLQVGRAVSATTIDVDVDTPFIRS